MLRAFGAFIFCVRFVVDTLIFHVEFELKNSLEYKILIAFE